MSEINRKIGIITFHFVNNFGGALQAYALRRVVEEKCGFDAEIIDYQNSFIRFTDFVRLFPITTNLKEFISGFKTFKLRIERIKRFRHFIKSCKKTGKYYTYWKLKHFPPKADKYICGSDQIWNPFLTLGVSPSYYLGFEKNRENKIAYAPSFGTEGVKNIYKKKISKYLKDIAYLSVREESGQNLIKELTGRDAERLIDPTFLLDKDEWSDISINPLKNKEPYILLYIMQRDEKVYEFARKIKEEKGIRLVEISRYGYNPGFVDETLVSIGPKEFLGLFKDAAFVCTNSYHGLVFSVIFERDFCLVPSIRFTARMNSLTKLLNIDNNKLSEDTCEAESRYDKEFAWNVINKEKEKAIEFLNKSIS